MFLMALEMGLEADGPLGGVGALGAFVPRIRRLPGNLCYPPLRFTDVHIIMASQIASMLRHIGAFETAAHPNTVLL